MTCTKPSTAPLELIPLLEKHALSWEVFSKAGRPASGVREKRQAIVTELHLSGMPWVKMAQVTGLSISGIQRLTLATGNAASRANRVAAATAVGHARKGEQKPWLSEQLRQAWGAGAFDFHRGRVRSSAERETLHLASLRPEVRERRSQAARRRWQCPKERERLLAYHRSEVVRRARSRAQVRRMSEDPVKWARGVGAWVDPVKCTRPRIWTRSSYERVVVRLLDTDPTVCEYVFEPRVELPTRRWILPDFVITHTDGTIVLLEVKASWVLALPEDHKVQRRLRDASTFAAAQGWEFLVWTEKDFGDAERRPT